MFHIGNGVEIACDEWFMHRETQKIFFTLESMSEDI